MRDRTPDTTTLPQHLQTALDRWDGEGGAGPDGPQDGSRPEMTHGDSDTSVHSELTRLRARVIALENLTIALLADASPHQLGLIRDMAAFMTPRLGAARHPVTIQAARQMICLADRAERFR